MRSGHDPASIPSPDGLPVWSERALPQQLSAAPELGRALPGGWLVSGRQQWVLTREHTGPPELRSHSALGNAPPHAWLCAAS